MSTQISGTSGVIFPDASTQNTAATGFGFKNRIINGAMMIDQRNAGASVTNTAGNYYTLDRWVTLTSVSSKFTTQQNAGSITPPVGFKNYLGITSSSSYAVGTSDYFLVGQPIEGLNVADFGWGSANAATVTLSFQVYSSLTGTFGGAIHNNGSARSYPFSYTISSANTWTPVSITITGDTTGTWLTNNGVGLYAWFSIGMGSSLSGTAGSWTAGGKYSATGATAVVGTNGATFYITGVQLEKGSTATSFDYRPYGTELALCQRYYCLVDSACGTASTTNASNLAIVFPVQMRTSPSCTMVSARLTDASTSDYTSTNPSPILRNVSQTGARLDITNFTGMTANRPSILLGSGVSAAPAQFSAEL